MTDRTTPRLVTQAEAAELLRCSVSTLARMRRAGEIKFIAGRPVRLRIEDVNRWIAKRACHATEAASGKYAGASPTQSVRVSGGAEALARGRRIALLRKR